MKSICKNIAFSKTGECLLGEKCICKANELWLAEDPDPSPIKEKESLVASNIPYADEEQQPEREVPKMSHELAAQSDIAAIEYGRLCDRFIGDRPYDNSHIVEAHECGQTWMYYRLQSEIQTLREEREAMLQVNRNIVDQNCSLVDERTRGNITYKKMCDLFDLKIQEANEFRQALEDMNSRLDKIWNTPGMSRGSNDSVMKLVCAIQQESATVLSKYPSTPPANNKAI